MTIYQILMTKYQQLFTNDYQISTNSYVRIYKQIMQNKPNLRKVKIDANSVFTKDYRKNNDSGHEKTNPIQTQFNPIQSQFKPKQTQFKPNNQSSLIDNHLFSPTQRPDKCNLSTYFYGQRCHYS